MGKQKVKLQKGSSQQEETNNRKFENRMRNEYK